MHLAPHWQAAVVAAVVLAFAARAARAVTWGGAAAGVVVGGACSLGFGPAGLTVLGVFFVAGSLATRVGWRTKTARGTAEATGGSRGGARVLGKGGVAAAIALLAVAGSGEDAAGLGPWFAGAVAAALADTLGTEVGTLGGGVARSVPLFRPVPAGTPGAVSALGTTAAAGGAMLVAAAAVLTGLAASPEGYGALTVAGVGASLVESCAVGAGLRAPGHVRNLLTTAAGAAIAGLAARL